MVKIISLNIEGDKHLNDVVKLIAREKPDLVCLQEIFRVDFFQFRRKLHLFGAFTPTVRIDIGGQPGFQKRGLFGTAIFSRQPNRFGRAVYAGQNGNRIPLYQGKPNAERRVLLWQTFPVNKLSLKIATTHFTWSRSGKATHRQRRELASLFRVLGRVQPDVLCGDFNAPRGREIFDRFAARFVDHIPKDTRSTLDPRLHYAKDVAVVVDGFFTKRNVGVKEIRLINGVSDHQAVIALVTVL